MPCSPSTLAMLMMLPDLCSSIGRERVLVDEERALEVHVEHAVPLVGVDHVHRSAARDARVVHDHVEATVLGHDRVDQRAHRSFVAHVERAYAVGRGDVGADDDRALLGEPLGGREPESRRRAGDQRDLALDASGLTCAHVNSGSTCLPMSSMVCITFSCGIL